MANPAPELTTTRVSLDTLERWPGNARRGIVSGIKESMRVNGVFQPLIVQKSTNRIIAGNHRYDALKELHEEQPDEWDGHADVVYLDVNDSRALKMNLADNKTSDDASWDDRALLDQLQSIIEDGDDLLGTGFAPDEVDDLAARLEDELDALTEDDAFDPEEAKKALPAASLSDRYGIPPLTVIDRRQGYWIRRSRAWWHAGLASHEGRKQALVYSSPHANYTNWYAVKDAAEAAAGRALTTDEIMASPEASRLSHISRAEGTSAFDPFLAELLYRWFSPDDGRVIDPWAGGSVRGIVAAALGRTYVGIDISGEQIEANRAQEAAFAYPEVIAAGADEEAQAAPAGRVTPEWVLGDSRERLKDMPSESFDMAIGCPPYYDLEQYSDAEGDLSRLSYKEFDAAMADTLREVGRTLKPNTFACFVVGSVRATQERNESRILDMRRCMTDAAAAAGMWLYHDAVLLDPIGNAAMRSGRPFRSTRMLTRTHQEVLVFVKGDRREAVARLGDVEGTLALPEADEDPADDAGDGE